MDKKTRQIIETQKETAEENAEKIRRFLLGRSFEGLPEDLRVSIEKICVSELNYWESEKNERIESLSEYIDVAIGIAEEDEVAEQQNVAQVDLDRYVEEDEGFLRAEQYRDELEDIEKEKKEIKPYF